MKQPESNQNGFTLVEILIATMILTVGLLAMAASTGYISNNLRNSKFDTQRTHAKEQVVEQLRGSTYSTLANSSQTIGNFTLSWSIIIPNSNAKRIQLVTAGPAFRLGRGAQTTVTDTMYFDIMSP